MTEQSNERIEADIALRSIIRRADNRIDADEYDRGFLAGQLSLIKVHFDCDKALIDLANIALDNLTRRSRNRHG
jgi:hypothetical protein